MKFLTTKDYKIFIIVSALFLLFIGLNYYFNYNLLRDNISRYESELFGRVHSKIEDWTSSNFKDVERISKLLINENISHAEQIQQLLHKFQQSSNFPYLIMGLEDGNFYISDKDYVNPHNYNLKSRDWYNDTLKAGTTIASNPYISMRLGLRSVSICTPIKLLDKRGVFCGGQPFEVIRGYFKEYRALYDKNLYLISKGGEILASFGNINETISFENITLPNEKYIAFGIKNTNWSLVFEKNQELYTSELNKYLLINLLLYAICVVIYIFTNFFWLRQNSVSTKQLDEQSLYIKDVLTKQADGIFVSCDENLNIVSSSVDFDKFYDLNKAQNLINGIRQSSVLSDDERENFIQELYESQKSEKLRYFNILLSDNDEIRKFLITTAPLSDKEPRALSLQLQDVSSIRQEIKNTSNEFYNPYIERIMLFIKQNIADDALCVEKLAKVGGYSKFHLQRLFKNYTNSNIAEYLRIFRLVRAEFLLRYCDEKVSVIAKECGFTHNETFIRAFSKTYGVAPLVYRQNLKQNIPSSQLIYKEINQASMKFGITHKTENVNFLSSKKNSDEMFVFVDNANLNTKFYGVHSKDSELSYMDIEAGKWAKIDINASNLKLDEIILKASQVFYDANLYNFKAPIIYYTLTNGEKPEFLYFKI